MLRRTIVLVIAVIILGLAVPTAAALLYQNNPPVKQEPPWDSPQTRALAARACFDCHSNQTVWPWYDKLPVSSWLAVFDTFRGRRNLNFSEWSPNARIGEGEGGEGGRRGGGDVARAIEDGRMPPGNYLALHPDASLTAQEKQQLIQGLQASLH